MHLKRETPKYLIAIDFLMYASENLFNYKSARRV